MSALAAMRGVRPRSPLPRALRAQLLAAATLLGLSAVTGLAGYTLSSLQLALAQGVLAALWSLPLGLPRWWLPLQLGFVPALYAAQALALPPAVYLLALVGCWLLLGNSLRDRVPLYLSSRAVWERLAQLLPDNGRFLDLGCGTGGGVARLARLRPDARCQGVEASPLLWLLCRLRLGRRVRLGSLWDTDLGGYDLVYAFLSPAPMAMLWEKARAEMAPGSLLVSNSFPVPGVEPDQVITLTDRRRSQLYLWRM